MKVAENSRSHRVKSEKSSRVVNSLHLDLPSRLLSPKDLSEMFDTSNYGDVGSDDRGSDNDQGS